MVLPLAPLATELPASLSEAVFQARVVEVARWHGWSLKYHTLHARGSDAGWPDLVLGRPRQGSLDAPREPLPLPELDRRRGLVLFVELKAEKGRVSPAQRVWLEHLHDCGLLVALWRPSDWQEVLAVLAGRATPTWPPRR